MYVSSCHTTTANHELESQYNMQADSCISCFKMSEFLLVFIFLRTTREIGDEYLYRMRSLVS
jgi:hypothetical protein